MLTSSKPLLFCLSVYALLLLLLLMSILALFTVAFSSWFLVVQALLCSGVPYIFNKLEDGAHAKVDDGNNFGILCPIWRKSFANISSNDGRNAGLRCNILVIKFLASLLIGTFSGNCYEFNLIFLYVVFTSLVSNGGFPINIVYITTPRLHISTSYEWPFLPSRISGAI